MHATLREDSLPPCFAGEAESPTRKRLKKEGAEIPPLAASILLTLEFVLILQNEFRRIDLHLRLHVLERDHRLQPLRIRDDPLPQLDRGIGEDERHLTFERPGVLPCRHAQRARLMI